MKQKIVRLPEGVINQIAAGEVVENPASIVKELIENSLDAGSKHIHIEIVAGGLQLIRVEDDGCGMGPEDALLCLERHATSKIASVDDLESLTTMGFRGEALAAISSVSHFELKTSDGEATRVLCEGGLIQVVEKCARNRGTTIDVRSLFYNVPARKKFQKSISTNSSQVTHIIETLALAHPEVGFSLTNNGKKTLELPPTSRKQRIEEVLGPYEHEIKTDLISGFIAAPVRAMPNRTGQYLFLNQRPIFSALLSKAVKTGFGTRIAEHAYPPFVLFLELAPDTVDVNVHPQKKEVRFKEESFLFRSVQKAIENAFVSSVVFSEPVVFTPPPADFSFAETFVSSSDFRVSTQEMIPELNLEFHDQVLGVFGTILLLRRENLLVVDLTAAHARILFESLKYEKPESQTLLWPLEIPLERDEEISLEELSTIGIEARILKKTLVVDAIPSCIEEAHFAPFYAHWKEGKKMETTATRFCRSLRKSYLLDEALLIWKKLQKCRDVLYDPLGNSIWRELEEKDLHQLISRKNSL